MAVNPLPTAFIFPAYANPILYPGFNIAAGVNPAALPLAQKTTAFQAAYTPALESGYPNDFFGGLAVSKRSLGIGLGYIRNQTSYAGQTTTTQSVFGGFGFSVDQVSLGVGLRDTYLANGFSPNVDIGLVVGDQKNARAVSFGAVFYNMDSLPQLDIGIGYGSIKKYTLEANILLPPFRYLDSGYVFTVAASLRAEILGLYFHTSYATNYKTFSHTVGIFAWLSDHVNVFAQFITSRTLSVGLSVDL